MISSELKEQILKLTERPDIEESIEVIPNFSIFFMSGYQEMREMR